MAQQLFAGIGFTVDSTYSCTSVRAKQQQLMRANDRTLEDTVAVGSGLTLGFGSLGFAQRTESQAYALCWLVDVENYCSAT